MEILAWQITVAISIAAARLFSKRAMIVAAVCWTAITLLAVWVHGLVLLQLGTAWGTVWVLSKLFGEPNNQAKETIARAGVSDASDPANTSMAATGGSTLGLNDFVRTTDSAVKRMSQSMDRFDELVKSQLEKQKANSDLDTQLFRLRLSTETAMKSGEHKLDLDKQLAESPEFAKAYRDLETTVSISNEKQTLMGLTLAPVDLSGVPDFAIEERLEWLRGALGQLERAGSRIDVDVELLKAVNSEWTPPFEHFIAEQINLLGRHISLLSPQTEASPVGTASKAVRSASSLIDKPDRHLERSKFHRAGAYKFDKVKYLNALRGLLDPPNEKQRGDQLASGLSRAISTDAATDVASADMPEVDDGPRYREPPNGPIRDEQSSSSVKKPGTILATATDTAPQARGIQEWDFGRQAEIDSLVHELRIPHLVHFTRCENLPGILQHGLMSVAASERKGISVVRNDESRWDGQLDGTSLSIALPNHLMFYKYRQLATGSDWAVLLISRRVLWEKDCAFYRHNAADGRMIRRPRSEMKSAQAMLDMFASDDGRDPLLRPYDPTDPQAEVMVYDVIEPGLVEAIAFETAEVRNRYRSFLDGLGSFCAGPGQGLFGTRRSTLAN